MTEYVTTSDVFKFSHHGVIIPVLEHKSKMIFEGRSIDEISDTEIERLVAEHACERRYLEFKVTVNVRSDPDRLEILRDIVSMANSGGGYLIIGIRDDGKGRAQKYEPGMIGDPDKIKRAVLALCLQHISERIDDLEIRPRTVNGNPLLIIRIPFSARIPHMVTFQNRTDFYSRYEDGKREMTLSEIREIFNQDLVARRLSRVEERLGILISSSESQKYATELSEKIKSGIYPRFLSIRDGATLADATTRWFIEEIGEKPYFRVAITPSNPHEGYFDVESEDVRTLFGNPPGSRRSGWNMEGNSRLERFEEGIRQGAKDSEYLELMSNGHMEFWTPLGEHFCWRQSPEEFGIRPRLNYYPVIEYPTTFLRLYRAILDALKTNDEFLIDLNYGNLKGYTLNPTPGRFGFDINGVRTFEGEHLMVPRRKVTGNFEPDVVTFDLLRAVYAAFGVDARLIPFYNGKERKFDFPSS